MSLIHIPSPPEIFYLYPKNKAFGDGKRIYPDGEREIYWNLNLLIGQPMYAGNEGCRITFVMFFAIALSILLLGSGVLLVTSTSDDVPIMGLFSCILGLFALYTPVVIVIRSRISHSRFRKLISTGQLRFGKVIDTQGKVVGIGRGLFIGTEISYQFESPIGGTIQTRHATRQRENIPMAGAQVYVLYVNDELYTLL
jgi:hypothetical protein